MTPVSRARRGRLIREIIASLPHTKTLEYIEQPIYDTVTLEAKQDRAEFFARPIGCETRAGYKTYADTNLYKGSMLPFLHTFIVTGIAVDGFTGTFGSFDFTLGQKRYLIVPISSVKRSEAQAVQDGRFCPWEFEMPLVIRDGLAFCAEIRRCPPMHSTLMLRVELHGIFVRPIE